LFWINAPLATLALSDDKNTLFCHALSLGSLACMCFLIAIMEDPVRSLSSAIASKIPCL
jgi:hypothetical protein